MNQTQGELTEIVIHVTVDCIYIGTAASCLPDCFPSYAKNNKTFNDEISNDVKVTPLMVHGTWVNPAMVAWHIGVLLEQLSICQFSDMKLIFITPEWVSVEELTVVFDIFLNTIDIAELNVIHERTCLYYLITRSASDVLSGWHYYEHHKSNAGLKGDIKDDFPIHLQLDGNNKLFVDETEAQHGDDCLLTHQDDKDSFTVDLNNDRDVLSHTIGEQMILGHKHAKNNCLHADEQNKFPIDNRLKPSFESLAPPKRKRLSVQLQPCLTTGSTTNDLIGSYILRITKDITTLHPFCGFADDTSLINHLTGIDGLSSPVYVIPLGSKKSNHCSFFDILLTERTTSMTNENDSNAVYYTDQNKQQPKMMNTLQRCELMFIPLLSELFDQSIQDIPMDLRRLLTSQILVLSEDYVPEKFILNIRKALAGVVWKMNKKSWGLAQKLGAGSISILMDDIPEDAQAPRMIWAPSLHQSREAIWQSAKSIFIKATTSGHGLSRNILSIKKSTSKTMLEMQLSKFLARHGTYA